MSEDAIEDFTPINDLENIRACFVMPAFYKTGKVTVDLVLHVPIVGS